MASSSYAWVRQLVGGIYLLKGVLLGLFALLALGSATVAAPVVGTLGVLPVVLVAGAFAFASCALGVGLIKGHRVALFLAILFAGLSALSHLTYGNVVGFALEAAIGCGLLLSRDVRSAYGS